jgi:hypothetical protein
VTHTLPGKFVIMHKLAPWIRPRPGLVLCIATAPLLAADAPIPRLPDLNEKVVAFARANLGKCVGDGSCTTLAISALESAGVRSYPSVEPGGALVWGQPVGSFEEALPGDILQFHDAVFQGKKATSKRRWTSWHHKYPHHTAIVSRVSEGGNVVAVLHQNVTISGKGDRNVLEGSLRIDSLQKGGWVRIYRPLAAPPHGREPAPPTSDAAADADELGSPAP